MKNILKSFILAIVWVFALAACSNPTPSTTTLQPTDTTLPKSTSRARPTLVLGERQRVEAGGYSLQIPSEFKIETHSSQVIINKKDKTILVSMSLSPRKAETQTAAAVLDAFIAEIVNGLQDFKAGKPYPAVVGGMDGLAVDATATMFGAKHSGRVTVVDTGKPGFLVAFAFAVDGADGNGWKTDGAQVFDAILNSIQFFEPVASTAATCTISSDESYGYTSENPIKVGGDDFDGPPRERAYLDNLAGPKGEKISYVRRGSNTFGDTILDIFEITSLGKTITLYVDEYSYTEPLAPAGFTCIAAFPLTQP